MEELKIEQLAVDYRVGSTSLIVAWCRIRVYYNAKELIQNKLR